MIVKSYVVNLLIGLGFISAVTGTSYSNVYVERGVPKEYYQYGTPYAPLVNPRLSQFNALPPVPSYISPCAPPCVLPGQAIAPSANIISYNAPSLPVVVAPAENPAGYQYQYVVYDEETGDHKAQREQSDGSVVRGEYSFLQPDGYVREVQYVADDVSGFNAVVRNFLPVKVEGNKRGEAKGVKNAAIHCLEVKHESLKKGSATLKDSSVSHGSQSHGNLHTTNSKKHAQIRLVNLDMEPNIPNKQVTKISHESQHHDTHINSKSQSKSSKLASSEENGHRSSSSKHGSEDVSHEIHHKKNKKGSKMEFDTGSSEESVENSKDKHQAHSKKGSDESVEKSKEKHHKAKKGPNHPAESSEGSSESSESEESNQHSKEKSKSKIGSGHGSSHDSEHGSSHESGHESGHDSKQASSHNAGHSSGHDAHSSEHDSGHNNGRGSGRNSKHGSEHESDHGSSHDDGHSSGHDSHSSEHDSEHNSKHGSGQKSEHGSSHGSGHSSEHNAHSSQHDLGHTSNHGSGHESDHGSSHDSGHSSTHDAHSAEHYSGRTSKHGSGNDSGHSSGHGSVENESHETHKSGHEVDEHQVLVPYNDIVRCVMQALQRSHGLPADMSQPSALSYLVLNKPC